MMTYEGGRSELREPDDQEALELFWSVYEDAYEEISAEMMEGLEDHPEFGPLLRSMSSNELAEQQRASLELMRHAVKDGAWEDYRTDLRTQGAGYARAGISFSSWFGLLTDLRRPLWRRLFEENERDPERLLRILLASEQVTDVAMATLGESYLREKERVIRDQAQAIQELSSPVLLLSPALLLLPLIGVIDSDRARVITENLLEAIRAARARVVVIDITGVPAVDSMVANHLIQTADAARLMGVTVIVTGMSTVNAQTLVRIGVDPNRLNTRGDLSAGLEEAERILRTGVPSEPLRVE